MKKTVMIYCGENGTAGKALALERNDDETSFATASGFEFAGVAESENCIIMSDLPSFKRNQISAAYGGKVELIKSDGESEKPATVHDFGPPPELAKLFTTPVEKKRKRGRPRKPVEEV